MYWNNIKDTSIMIKYLRLTLTWDVLKWLLYLYGWHKRYRLTLTWDVLKYVCNTLIYCMGEININMRCIEMRKARGEPSASKWLTLTWDVLKSVHRCYRFLQTD